MVFSKARLAFLATLCALAPLLQFPGVQSAAVPARKYTGRPSNLAIEDNSIVHTQRFFSAPRSSKNFQRRRDVDIADKGNSKVYRVPHRTREARHARSQAFRMRKRADDGTPGKVEIKSSDKRLAYLEMMNQNGTYVWNASEKNSTQVFLAKLPAESFDPPSGAKDITGVRLSVPMNDGSTYCVTYDPSPGDTPGPMTAQKCVDAPSKVSSPHQSQVFWYNETSNALQPTWFSGEDDGRQDSSSTVDGGDIGGTYQASVVPRDQGYPSVQNVTLIFVPNDGMNSKDATDNSTPSSSSTYAQMMTTTVTVTAATASSTSTASSGAASAAAASSSSVGAPSAASTPSKSLDVELVGGSSTSASNGATPTSASAAGASQSSMSPANATIPASSGTSIGQQAASTSSTASAGAAAQTSGGTAALNTSATPSAAVASATTPSGSLSGTRVAIAEPRAVMTGVSTEPYKWQFTKNTA